MNTANINSINTCCFEDESAMHTITNGNKFLKRIHLNRIKILRKVAAVKNYYLSHESMVSQLLLVIICTFVMALMTNAITDAFNV